MIKNNGATIFAYFEFNCYGENTFFTIVKCFVSATFVYIHFIFPSGLLLNRDHYCSDELIRIPVFDLDPDP